VTEPGKGAKVNCGLCAQLIESGGYTESSTHRRLIRGEMCTNVSKVIPDTNGAGGSQGAAQFAALHTSAWLQLSWPDPPPPLVVVERPSAGMSDAWLRPHPVADSGIWGGRRCCESGCQRAQHG
jgi:hypothetical protein